jgi:hypothetical protein
VEWFDGRDLAVYCDRPRLFAKLWAIPGVRRHQTGDQEMRATFPPEALEQVAAVIRAKRWGGSGRGHVGNLVADAGQTGTSAAYDRVQKARMALGMGIPGGPPESARLSVLP